MGNSCSYKSSRRSSHVSTGHLVAPPNTSTLLSTQGMTLPGMLVEQLAIFMMSSAFNTLSHILNWLISPTKAWVASNLPPTVSFRHTRFRIREGYFNIWFFRLEDTRSPATLLAGAELGQTNNFKFLEGLLWTRCSMEQLKAPIWSVSKQFKANSSDRIPSHKGYA